MVWAILAETDPFEHPFFRWLILCWTIIGAFFIWVVVAVVIERIKELLRGPTEAELLEKKEKEWRTCDMCRERPAERLIVRNRNPPMEAVCQPCLAQLNAVKRERHQRLPQDYGPYTLERKSTIDYWNRFVGVPRVAREKTAVDNSRESSDYIVLDLETTRSAQEVGGWVPERLGLAVAVTWDQRNGFREWYEDDVSTLVCELTRFRRVIGFNLLHFDYGVLGAYYKGSLKSLESKTVDILADVYKTLGFRVSLDNMARATLGKGKSGSGLQAVELWREGKRDLVIQYCRADVELTRDIYLHGMTHGVVYYPSFGKRRAMRVDWS